MIELYERVIESVADQGMPVDGPSTYLGPIKQRLTGLHVRVSGPDQEWTLQSSPFIRDELGSIYLPKYFNELCEQLMINPLCKNGIKDDPSKNMDFLMNEAYSWLGYEGSSDGYPEMWDGVQNVSQYSDTASQRRSFLTAKVGDLLSLKLNSNTRSFELRFPEDYCPVVWSIQLSPDMSSLNASLVFRSLEVSRNILNDLYLFHVYFGKIFAYFNSPSKTSFAVPITATSLYVQDAHIIDFGKN